MHSNFFNHLMLNWLYAPFSNGTDLHKCINELHLSEFKTLLWRAGDMELNKVFEFLDYLVYIIYSAA